MSALLVVLVPVILAAFAMQMERIEGRVLQDRHTDISENSHAG